MCGGDENDDDDDDDDENDDEMCGDIISSCTSTSCRNHT